MAALQGTNAESADGTGTIELEGANDAGVTELPVGAMEGCSFELGIGAL